MQVNCFVASRLGLIAPKKVVNEVCMSNTVIVFVFIPDKANLHKNHFCLIQLLFAFHLIVTYHIQQTTFTQEHLRQFTDPLWYIPIGHVSISSSKTI